MAQKHVVEPGECLASIARQYGFVDWRVIWNAQDNKALRDKRHDPGVLAPGDEVVIPDKKARDVSVARGAAADVSLNRPKVFFRVTLKQGVDGDPVKGKFELTVVGVELPITGDITPDGAVEAEIPATAKQGRLSIFADDSSEPTESFDVVLGHLDPPDTVAGAQARLLRLGYDCGPIDGELGPRTCGALAAFQMSQGLDPVGELNDDTSKALAKLTET
jgi:hypothetical protein